MAEITRTTRVALSLLLAGIIIVINVGTEIGVLYGWIRDHPLSLLILITISLLVVRGLLYLFGRFVKGADHEKTETLLE